MSVVSQRFSRTSNAGGAPARENNVVSFGGAIGARGLAPGPDLRPCKSLTCSDAMRTGPNGRHRSLLRLTECSHHVGSSGIWSWCWAGRLEPSGAALRKRWYSFLLLHDSARSLGVIEPVGPMTIWAWTQRRPAATRRTMCFRKFGLAANRPDGEIDHLLEQTGQAVVGVAGQGPV
jgi:hypothetical protein